jgi:hypothetical protein
VLPLKVKNVDPPDFCDMEIAAVAQTEVREEMKVMAPLTARHYTYLYVTHPARSLTVLCNQQKCLISTLVSVVLLHLLNVMKILVSFKLTRLKIHLFLFWISPYKSSDTPL